MSETSQPPLRIHAYLDGTIRYRCLCALYRAGADTQPCMESHLRFDKQDLVPSMRIFTQRVVAD